MKSLLLCVAMLFAVLLAGCSSGNSTSTPPAVTLVSITVTPANSTVPVGTLTPFTATGTYSNDTTQDLTATATWMSSNTAVATIAAGGLSTALTTSATAITITATSGTVSGNTGLTVGAATLTSIEIPSGPMNTVTIANGTSYQFTAYGFYNDGSKHNLTNKVAWSSLNTASATIGAGTGRAQAVGSNTSTTITAMLGTVSGAATLDVSAASILSIAVGPSSTTIAPLTTETFTAIGTFTDNSMQNISQDVTWASSTAAAAISNTAGSVGVATGVAPGGAATISGTFSFGGSTATGFAPLTVSSATLSSIAVTPSSAGMTLNSNLALQAIATFSDGTTQHVETVATWLSSAPSVVALNGNIATGETTRPATITCELGGVTSNAASLTVEGFTAITITGSATVAEGTSVNLVATGTLTDGTTQNITSSVLWTSSDPSLATVSNASGSFGSAAGIAPGTVTVIAVFGGQIGSASVTVSDATLSTIAIKPANPTIAQGSRQQFSATGMFSDGSTENLSQQVTWSSSDVAVAIIDGSGAASTTTVTGTAAIAATFGAIDDTTVLTVN